jgi:hypothetical protein
MRKLLSSVVVVVNIYAGPFDAHVYCSWGAVFFLGVFFAACPVPRHISTTTEDSSFLKDF